MKLEIEWVKNGYIVTSGFVDEEEKNIFEETETEVVCFENLARFLIDYFGINSDRYAHERFYSIIGPGDKNDGFEEFTDKHVGDVI